MVSGDVVALVDGAQAGAAGTVGALLQEFAGACGRRLVPGGVTYIITLVSVGYDRTGLPLSMPACFFVHPSVCLSVCPPVICSPVCLSVGLPVRLSVRLSIFPSACLPLCFSDCPYRSWRLLPCNTVDLRLAMVLSPLLATNGQLCH